MNDSFPPLAAFPGDTLNPTKETSPLNSFSIAYQVGIPCTGKSRR